MAGIDIDLNEKHHGPCPKCGGTDRFRTIDSACGALFCGQCFKEKNGDGIAALCWLTGKPFKEVVPLLAAFLGIKPSQNGSTKSTPSKSSPIFATIKGLARAIMAPLIEKHGAGVKLAAHWAYPTFKVLRINLPTPAGEKQRKEFRPIHQVPLGTSGAKGWKAGYPEGPRPLYRLPEITALAIDLITIHGGEKAADAAADLGLPSTTNAGGEQAIKKTDWARSLALPWRRSSLTRIRPGRSSARPWRPC